ncbi:hypothetical protein FRC02_003547 [Tulasnella sp. 418]|nr:hypothetical protein FRC02_003547 [Tulasnella sp. 418]
MATFDELITASVPLKDLEDCYTRILRFARFTSECAEFEAVPITLRLLNILVQQLCSFFSALESAYQPDVFSQLINSFREWTSSLDNGDPKIPAEIIPAILSISDDLMSRAASRLLCPPLERLKADSPSISDIISCYLSLAYIIIHFYLPEIPIDPSVIQRCTSDFLRGELEILDARIAVNRHAELLASGNQKSLTTALLESERDKILGQLKDDDIIGLHRKPDVERLHSLFGEISQFFNSIIGEERIRMILAGLESGAEGCISREATIQGSITGFLQRIHTTYEDLLDIVKPFSDATQVIRFALRMEAQLHLQRRSDAGGLTSCIKALVTIPQTIAASRFIAIKRSELLQATKSHVPLSEWLVLELWGLVHELRAGRDRQWCLSRIEETYEELFQLWRNEKDKESRENAESQSLYRPRKERENAAGSPEEQEEREFLQLFPRFDEGEDPTFASRPSRKTAQSYFPSSPIRDIYTAHQQIFLSQETPGGTALSLRAGDILKRLVSLLSSEAVDEASVAYRLHLLSDKIKTFEQNSTSQQSPSPDFYHDTNIREARRAVTTLEPLMARLNDLITEWPDQMILHHIRDRCEVIVGYGMDSPVAKLLAGLEQLVTQMEDWESYSNRENSLKAYQQQIASLIIDWRRLELACWSGLLESEMEAFRVHVHEWWFHLYEVVVHGTMSATQAVDSTDASVDQHIADLSQLLDQYIETSSLGEFDQRLRLLLSFYYFLDALQRPKAGRIQVAVRRVSRVVWSIHGFYAQFRPNVMSRMAQEKRVLEDQIRDFIKLASWKDINVHSLRASAQRTHHQLYKLIRKFREVLRQPVSSFFVSPVDEDSTETSLEPPSTATRSLNQDRSSFSHSPQLAFQDSQANPRFDLPRVIGRLDGVITELLEPLLVLPKAQSLEGLSVDIILTTRKFAATKIEANSPDARSKAVKALTVQKRKAWADLLKELKQAGVPQNVRPEILTHQQSRHWMLELVEPSCDGVEENLTKKANGYHYRLLSSLPRLRQSLRNHHSDVSTRDLQRGVAFVESLLNTALISRTRLSVMLENYRVLSRAIDRLRVLSTHKLGYIGFTLPRELSDVPESLFQLTSALEEAQACLLDYLLCVEKDGGVSKLTTDAQSGVRDLLSDLLQAKEEMRCMSEKILVGDVVILLEDELSLLRTSKALLLRAERVLTTLSKDPVVHRYCESIIAWLQTSRAYLRPEPDRKKPTHPDEDIVSAILVIVQNLVKVAELRDEDPDQYFSCNNITLGRTTSALDLELVVQMLLRFIAGMVDSSPESFEGLQQNIGCVLPFLERYLRLVRLHLAEIGNWTKSVYKLTYVLCSTAQTLAEKGFCKPLEEGDSHENGEGTAELAEGTGLGEGSGRENVSNQIEDESQVEGLQGEDSAPKEKDDDGNPDNDAIEMADNFAGDLEDVESNAENSEDDKSDGDEAQHDEQMESLDPLDPNAVDEKLWGKESHSDDQETLENTEKNGQADENSEMAAREDEKAKRKKDNDTLQEEEKEGTLDNDSANEDVGPDLDPNEPDLGAKMDEYPAETDALDLPDDLELDTDVKGDEDGMDVDDEDIGDSLEDTASDLGQTNDDNPERDLEEGSDIAEGSERDIESSKDGEDAQDRDAAAKDDVASQPQDASRADQGTQGVKNDTKGQGNATEGHEGAEDEEAHASVDNEERHPQELGDKQNEENKSFPERTSHTLEERDGTQGTTAGTRDVEDPKSHPQVENKPIPNPIRHLGDALKEIRRHFEEISTAAQDQEAPNQNAQSESTRLEYLQDDRSDEEMQALGPSSADDANTKLRDLKISEDEDVAPIIEDIEDTSMVPEEQTPTRQQPQMAPPSEKPINKERGDLEPAVVERPDSLSNDAVMEQDQLKDDPYEIGRKEQESTSDEELVESELRRWLHSDGGSANTTAESLWRLYEGLTHDLSFALCEQLRLILSPTLATRLKGDYKTGKRLNMKKIIPYIASEFTKDKIWLRRTKPSQREYQVLMALDDSKSMAETHSVHLAYQTLALVSKALSRLEVGEVGVAKFGQTVEMLKGFDDATNRGNLTDVEGARILGSFSFNQSATNVLELLDTSLEVLREARERRTGTASGSQRATLWQLEIIISDGICQNHEKMRALLRRAEEQKVMIVFVILDSLHRQPTALPSSSQTSLTPASSSILSMNQVEYKKNLVTGKMEMTMGRYLDTFPFEYYIVLRDVEALPDVLARTLREFFEKTVEE